MNMPFGNIQGLMQGFQQFMGQRQQFLNQIPKEMGQDPNQIIQNMMNNGSVSQQQYNQAKSIANMLSRFMPKN